MIGSRATVQAILHSNAQKKWAAASVCRAADDVMLMALNNRISDTRLALSAAMYATDAANPDCNHQDTVACATEDRWQLSQLLEITYGR